MIIRVVTLAQNKAKLFHFMVCSFIMNQRLSIFGPVAAQDSIVIVGVQCVLCLCLPRLLGKHQSKAMSAPKHTGATKIKKLQKGGIRASRTEI